MNKTSRIDVAMQISRAISRTLSVVIFVIVIVGGIAGVYVVETPTSSPQSVQFMLDFTPAGSHALFYYGVDHGIYSKNKLNVTILPGQGSAATIAAVASGSVDFGFADAGTLVASAAASSISNVRIIAMIFQKTSYAVIYNKADVSSVQDLNGKTIANFQGSGAGALFKVFAQANNLNYSSIRFSYASAATYNQMVVLGTAAASVATVGQLADLAPVAAQKNIQLGLFPYAQYGLNIYGLGIITNTKMINAHPEIVKEFVQATMQSVLGAVQNPNSAVTALLNHNPQLNFSKSYQDFELMINNTLPANVNSTSNALALGWVDPQTMQDTVNIVAQGYGFANPPSASALYTDDYVQSP